MSGDITLQKQKEVWRGRDNIIEIKVIGEGPGGGGVSHCCFAP